MATTAATATTVSEVVSVWPCSANRMASTAWVNGFHCASVASQAEPDSRSFHSGYSALLMKNMGKMTKFMAPAKFSSWRTYTDSHSPSAASMKAASARVGRAARACHGSTSTPSAHEMPTNTAICSTDSTLAPTSLASSSQARGSGAVSSRRMAPVSRSYTRASELCMPLNSATMPSRPGSTYSR